MQCSHRLRIQLRPSYISIMHFYHTFLSYISIIHFYHTFSIIHFLSYIFYHTFSNALKIFNHLSLFTVDLVHYSGPPKCLLSVLLRVPHRFLRRFPPLVHIHYCARRVRGYHLHTAILNSHLLNVFWFQRVPPLNTRPTLPRIRFFLSRFQFLFFFLSFFVFYHCYDFLLIIIHYNLAIYARL